MRKQVHVLGKPAPPARREGAAMAECRLCPRRCGADRSRGPGACRAGAELRIGRAAPHYGEEPCISGERGSGAVFFAGCPLGCVYCQNYALSRGREGKIVTAERLAEIFFELKEQGAHNINLVTPEHFVPLIIPALRRARSQGLSIPVVYNTGSYEKVEAVRALEGLVDVWLPDLKYVSPRLSALHTGAADYFECASAAIAEMVRQCPEPVFSDGSHAIDCPDDADDPLLIRGVLVRHLALPGCGEDSRAVLRYLHETYGDHIFISIMNQYTPMPQVLARQLTEAHLPGRGSVPGPGGLSDLCRTLSAEEYDSLVDYAIGLGIQNGFVQESGTVSPSYIPVFDGTGI